MPKYYSITIRIISIITLIAFISTQVAWGYEGRSLSTQPQKSHLRSEQLSNRSIAIGDFASADEAKGDAAGANANGARDFINRKFVAQERKKWEKEKNDKEETIDEKSKMRRYVAEEIILLAQDPASDISRSGIHKSGDRLYHQMVNHRIGFGNFTRAVRAAQSLAQSWGFQKTAERLAAIRNFDNHSQDGILNSIIEAVGKGINPLSEDFRAQYGSIYVYTTDKEGLYGHLPKGLRFKTAIADARKKARKLNKYTIARKLSYEKLYAEQFGRPIVNAKNIRRLLREAVSKRGEDVFSGSFRDSQVYSMIYGVPENRAVYKGKDKLKQAMDDAGLDYEELRTRHFILKAERAGFPVTNRNTIRTQLRGAVKNGNDIFSNDFQRKILFWKIARLPEEHSVYKGEDKLRQAVIDAGLDYDVLLQQHNEKQDRELASELKAARVELERKLLKKPLRLTREQLNEANSRAFSRSKNTSGARANMAGDAILQNGRADNLSGQVYVSYDPSRTINRKKLLRLLIELRQSFYSSLGIIVRPIIATIIIAPIETALNAIVSFIKTSPTKIAIALPLKISISAVPKAFLRVLVKYASFIRKNITYILFFVNKVDLGSGNDVATYEAVTSAKFPKGPDMFLGTDLIDSYGGAGVANMAGDAAPGTDTDSAVQAPRPVDKVHEWAEVLRREIEPKLFDMRVMLKEDGLSAKIKAKAIDIAEAEKDILSGLRDDIIFNQYPLSVVLFKIFEGTVAHNINNPLNNIMAIIGLVTERGSILQKDVELVDRNISRIDDFLKVLAGLEEVRVPRIKYIPPMMIYIPGVKEIKDYPYVLNSFIPEDILQELHEEVVVTMLDEAREQKKAKLVIVVDDRPLAEQLKVQGIEVRDTQSLEEAESIAEAFHDLFFAIILNPADNTIQLRGLPPVEIKGEVRKSLRELLGYDV